MKKEIIVYYETAGTEVMSQLLPKVLKGIAFGGPLCVGIVHLAFESLLLDSFLSLSVLVLFFVVWHIYNVIEDILSNNIAFVIKEEGIDFHFYGFIPWEEIIGIGVSPPYNHMENLIFTIKRSYKRIIQFKLPLILKIRNVLMIPFGTDITACFPYLSLSHSSIIEECQKYIDI
jgi:hypothetical protein